MAEVKWTVRLARPGLPELSLFHLEDPLRHEQMAVKELGDLHARVRVEPRMTRSGRGYAWVEAQVVNSAAGEPAACYLSLAGEYDRGELHTFMGPTAERELYRQSPHDPADHQVNMAKQAVPMAALRDGDVWTVALSDNPAHSANYTTQLLDPEARTFAISSGDSGEMPNYQGKGFVPYYHPVTPGQPHTFHLVLFESAAADFSALRMDLFEVIDAAWGEGSSRFHALCFATNYMHLRHNELGYSDVWITPGIEYANKQYTRDAFWQSMILPLALQQQCYDAVYEERYKYAETGLIFLIWSHRIQRSGGQADLARAQDALDYVESNTRNGWYIAPRNRPSPNFRSWYDIVSFEDDDVLSYNQGLLPSALLAARAIGLRPTTSPEQAVANYRALYLPDGGFFPLSQRKRFLCVDALVGDTLAAVEFGQPLLEDAPVRQHYATLMARAKTPYGFKVTCAEDGSLLPAEAHGAHGYLNPFFTKYPAGTYVWGGSWFLYDMLCLMSCYLHGAEGAEDQIIERMALEIRLGGTYHEFINTVTGQPSKPTYGWNSGAYSLWEMLVQQGRASRRFLDEIEALLKG